MSMRNNWVQVEQDWYNLNNIVQFSYCRGDDGCVYVQALDNCGEEIFHVQLKDFEEAEEYVMDLLGV